MADEKSAVDTKGPAQPNFPKRGDSASAPSPVENFDPEKGSKSRRMFGNGDTDRSDGKESESRQ